jgi:hypothetical protein
MERTQILHPESANQSYGHDDNSHSHSSTVSPFLLHRLLCPKTKTSLCWSLLIISCIAFTGVYAFQSYLPDLSNKPIYEYTYNDYQIGAPTKVGQSLQTVANQDRHSCYTSLDAGLLHNHVMLARNVTHDNSKSFRGDWNSKHSEALRTGRSMAFFHFSNIKLYRSRLTESGKLFKTETSTVPRIPVHCFWLDLTQQLTQNRRNYVVNKKNPWSFDRLPSSEQTFDDHILVEYSTLDGVTRQNTSLFGREAYCLQHFESVLHNNMDCIKDHKVEL